MSKSYTHAETIEIISNAAKNMPTFYRANVINYGSKTSDTKEYYTEIVAGWLLEHMDYLTNAHIPIVTRKSSYKSSQRNGTTPNASSNRIEERIALDVKRNGTIAPLGTILDYQTPLKNKRSDDAGKIDILSLDNNGSLRILELKKPGSKETLLRCALEGYTYMLTVAQNKLFDDFQISKCTKIQACPIFFADSRQYIEYEQMISGLRPNLFELIKKLDEELFLLSDNGIGVDRHGTYKKYFSVSLDC